MRKELLKYIRTAIIKLFSITVIISFGILIMNKTALAVDTNPYAAAFPAKVTLYSTIQDNHSFIVVENLNFMRSK